MSNVLKMNGISYQIMSYEDVLEWCKTTQETLFSLTDRAITSIVYGSTTELSVLYDKAIKASQGINSIDINEKVTIPMLELLAEINCGSEVCLGILSFLAGKSQTSSLHQNLMLVIETSQEQPKEQLRKELYQRFMCILYNKIHGSSFIVPSLDLQLMNIACKAKVK